VKFDELVKYLSEQLDIELEPETDDNITIEIDDQFRIQLEMDRGNQCLFIIAFIQDLYPGKFRENVFLHALKANHLPERSGSFGFYYEENKITFHRFFPSLDLNGEVILSFLTEIIYVAKSWRAAFDNGRPGPDEAITNKDHASKPFGLKP